MLWATEMTKEFFTDIETFAGLLASFRELSPTAPVWYLGYEERWRILSELLLGHPLIREGKRPRDFPSDKTGRNILQAITSLQSRHVRPWSGLPPTRVCDFGTWIYAFAIAIEGSIADDSNSDSKQETYHAATLIVVWQILSILHLHDKSGCRDHLLGALGISTREANALGTLVDSQNLDPGKFPLKRAPVTKCAAEAAFLAASAMDSAQLLGELGFNRNSWRFALEKVLDRPFWILSIKASQVQKYIGKAKNFQMARGASAWVTQSLSSVRELFHDAKSNPCSVPANWLLLSDTDAIVKFVCFEEPDILDICKWTREILTFTWLSKAGLQSANPRLHDLLRSHESLFAKQNEVLSCLPDFGIQASKKLSLRQFSMLPDTYGLPGTDSQSPDMRHYLSFAQSGNIDVECAKVEGESPLIPEGSVPWLFGRKGNPKTSWCSIVWSLAGRSYGTQTSCGMADLLGLGFVPVKRLHSDWLQGLGEESVLVGYLMIDGDNIGQLFRKSSALRGLTISLRLFAEIFERLLAGTRCIIEAWSKVHGIKQVPILPIDLIYIGGDDLLCIIPGHFLESFLDGFSKPLRLGVVETFTGAMITIDPFAPKLGVEMESVAGSILPKALAVAKAISKGYTQDVVQSHMENLRRSATDYGCDIEISTESAASSLNINCHVFHLVARPSSRLLSI